MTHSFKSAPQAETCRYPLTLLSSFPSSPPLPLLSLVPGTSMGIALSSSLGSSWTALLPVFASLSFVHLTCNYLSLGHVSLNTINMEVRSPTPPPRS